MGCENQSLKELYESGDIACRHYKSLLRLGYQTLDEVAELSQEEIYSIKNIGRKGIYPLLILMKEYGIRDYITCQAVMDMKEVHMTKKCIFIVGNILEVKEASPEANLLFDVLDGEFYIKKKYFDMIDVIVKEVLSTLTDREVKVLTLRYGLSLNNGGWSREKVGEAFSVSADRIRQIEHKALRKLRHPSRSRRLRGAKCPFNYSDGYIVWEFNNNLIDILEAELVAVLSNNKRKRIYLDNVLIRNDIEIENVSTDKLDNFEILQKSIEELDLSVRVYNCLKRQNINTINDLKNYEGDLNKIPYLDEGDVSEIMGRISLILSEDSKVDMRTFVLTIDGQKIVYKCLSEELEVIAKNILNTEILKKDNTKNIFESPLSPGLVSILLLKGYIYENDIYSNAETISKELRAGNFSEFADELIKIASFEGSDERIIGSINCSKDVMEYCEIMSGFNCNDIINEAEVEDRKDVIDFIKGLTSR